MRRLRGWHKSCRLVHSFKFLLNIPSKLCFIIQATFVTTRIIVFLENFEFDSNFSNSTNYNMPYFLFNFFPDYKKLGLIRPNIQNMNLPLFEIMSSTAFLSKVFFLAHTVSYARVEHLLKNHKILIK